MMKSDNLRNDIDIEKGKKSTRLKNDNISENENEQKMTSTKNITVNKKRHQQ